MESQIENEEDEQLRLVMEQSEKENKEY